MTHFDEMACLLYLDGQLDPARSSELAAHAGECASCRDLLRALELETKFLSRAMIEDNESLPARLARAREQGSRSWIWAVAFGGIAAGVYGFWTNGIGPWLDQLTNAGFGGTDMFSLILFSGAFWEGWSDIMDAIQIGALILLAILAGAWIRQRLRRRSVGVAVVMSGLLFLLALPQPAAAADVRHGQSLMIPAGESVHNDLIVAGPSVRVDGAVEGDLIAFTQSLTVTGHVTGDVIAFAGETLIDGTVDGNVRVFTRNLIVQGSVGKNVSAIAHTIDMASKSTVGGGVIAIGADADLDGKMQRDLLGILGRTELDGLIGGQLWVRGGTLEVDSNAEIRGPATFVGHEQPVVESGAKLASPIHTEIAPEPRRRRRSAAAQVVRTIFRYGVALGFGALLLVVLPGFFRAALRETGSVGLPIGIGAVAVISAIFLLILGVVMLFAGAGAGLAGVMALAPALYIAQVFVGTWLGNRILGEGSSGTGVIIGRMALGLLILYVVRIIPILGGMVWSVVLIWGAGAVLLAFYRMSRTGSAPVPA